MNIMSTLCCSLTNNFSTFDYSHHMFINKQLQLCWLFTNKHVSFSLLFIDKYLFPRPFFIMDIWQVWIGADPIVSWTSSLNFFLKIFLKKMLKFFKLKNVISLDWFQTWFLGLIRFLKMKNKKEVWIGTP
jgi:hypothetical protein